MKHRGKQPNNRRLSRFLSGLLCAAVLCGLVPSGVTLTGSAQAAEQAVLAWSDQDLDTLRSYDIMHGDDGGMRPNDSISRAEFAAMVNRALGYKERANSTPFKDVASSDWFSDDISISYNMGYLNGITSTAAGPYSTLTREQALVILSRNLMFQPTVGESFSYADTRTFGEWSRGYIDPAVEAGILDADPASNFDPGEPITRGELAGMLLRAIGTPIQTAGVRSLGTVDGNVTITTPGVTLRNTTINGDLYLTGGIGLGDVLLDSVTVNGKIIDSGAGLSEKGEISVILNNVTADELIVDSMRNQTISLSAKGNTEIPKTSLRTSARVEDSTATGYGLRVVEIDGEEKTSAVLSGNVKEVVNKTPNSTLNIGEGVAEKVTVDEAATGSSVTVGKDARIKYLNLDAGASVTGSGMVDSLTISAAGATLNLPQMPDEIIIAPGVTANVNKQQMDSAAAAEASSRPRLLPGYPGVENLAPTSATALFQTNKPGTVYWAITARADGSPAEEDIISPPSYSKNIVKSGSVKVKESNKEYTARISGLTSDGAYYLSVIMVDDKGVRSTMKVTAFTTPDNTTPAFSKGYPVAAQISEKDAQFSVMTTKDCDLYYAVLPKGSTAPRAIDFKTGTISGNLGRGLVKMEKNNPVNLFVNDVSLEEQKDYVLYLWLNDFDGAKSSAVKAVNFTTQDRTNPIVSNLRQTDTKATSATMSYSLSEQGTLYWAVVASGNETFMSPSSNTVTGVPFLQTQEAKERVVSGVGALKKGTSTVSAAKAGADIGFTASGLNSKTTGTSAYDLYYVARDKAGNWSDAVNKITIYTLDTNAPTVVLNFTSFNEGEDETTTEPLADTDIRLVFSKTVRVVDKDANGVSQEYPFLDLYQQGRQAELAEALRKHILLYKVPTSGSPIRAQDELTNPSGFDLNYSRAEVFLDGTNMVVEFPYSTNDSQTAHHLSNGGEYYFELSGIQDTTSNHNPMAKTTLNFKTKQAQVNISSPGVSELTNILDESGNPLAADFSFQLDAKATSSSPDGIFYDILLWTDKSLTFDLYRREGTAGNWQLVGVNSGSQGLFQYTIPAKSDRMYQTIAGVQKSGNNYPYEELKELKESTSYQYAVHIKTLGSSNDKRETWNLDCNMGVSVVAGQKGDLNNLAGGNGTLANWENQVQNRLNSIGNPDPYIRQVTISDSVAPVLSGIYPQFDPRDTMARMTFQLDRPGTVYYVVTPVTPTGSGGFANPVPPTFVESVLSDPSINKVPSSGQNIMHIDGERGKEFSEVYLVLPDRDGIISKTISDVDVRQGSIANDGDSTSSVDLRELKADTWYYVYLMFQGNNTSDRAVCYKFKTDAAYTPQIALSTEGTAQAGTVKATVTKSSANVNARLIPISSLANTFFSHKFDGSSDTSSNLGFDFLIKGAPDSVKNLTVLEAMRRDNNGPSIFDTYASDDLKTYVSDLIVSGGSTSGTGSIATKTLQITMSDADHDNSQIMEFPGLSKNSEYFCVAVAANTSDPTKQGFRAIRPVSTIDTTPPTVGSATGTLRIEREDKPNKKSDGTITGGETIFTLTGTVNINYRGYLYVKEGDTAVPFTQGGQVGKKQNGQTYPDPQQFFDALERRWGGVNSISVGGNMYAIQPILTQTTPNMTQTLEITVKYDLGKRQYEQKTEQITETVVVDGKETTQTKTVTTWVPPEIPQVTGEISIPTGFVSANGDNVDIVGRITYQNTKGNENVTVRYSAR